MWQWKDSTNKRAYASNVIMKRQYQQRLIKNNVHNHYSSEFRIKIYIMPKWKIVLVFKKIYSDV